MDFYFSGGKLFSYASDFMTHRKYAAALNWGKDYLSESNLEQVEHFKDFLSAYSQIQENCASRSGIEAQGVSLVCAKHSYARCKLADRPVVLDVEVQFRADSMHALRDRIDILFFIPESKTLLFCEAKHFSNPEIWAREGERPEVVEQIVRYRKKIAETESDILNAYSSYVEVVNDLFAMSYPRPARVHPEVVLLVFGFDADQRDGRLKRLLLADGSLEGVLVGTATSTDIPCYAIGDASKIELTSMLRRVSL